MTEALAINSLCPNSGKPVVGTSLTQYRGRTVGFCNPGCRDTFAHAVDMFDAVIDVRGGGSLRASFVRHARFNKWMNERLLACLTDVPESELWADRGAYFNSILGTLNHILVWDIVWLQRFAAHAIRDDALAWILERPKPTSHDQVLCKTLPDLKHARDELDDTLVDYTRSLREDEFDSVLVYTLQSGEVVRKHLGGVVQHLFNHQTHHRGQVTTLMTQMGLVVPETDLLLTIGKNAL